MGDARIQQMQDHNDKHWEWSLVLVCAADIGFPSEFFRGHGIDFIEENYWIFRRMG